MGMATKAHIPKPYQIIEFFYRRFIIRMRYMQLSQIEGWDKILTEKINPLQLPVACLSQEISLQ